jgi:hypothetical protein
VVSLFCAQGGADRRNGPEDATGCGAERLATLGTSISKVDRARRKPTTSRIAERWVIASPNPSNPLAPPENLQGHYYAIKKRGKELCKPELAETSKVARKLSNG